MDDIQMAFLTKAAIASGVLFVIAYFGNLLSFSSRFINALVTAIIFAVIFAVLYFVVDGATLPANAQEASQNVMLRMIGMSAILVFVVDLIANMLSFNNRFMSALTTAVLFFILFIAVVFGSGSIPSIPA